MLNLLIAYISDSFEKLMAVNTQAFNYERLRLILEYKRQVRSLSKAGGIRRKILFYLQNQHKSVDDDVNERIRLKIDRLELKIDKQSKDMKDFRHDLDDQFERIHPQLRVHHDS